MESHGSKYPLTKEPFVKPLSNSKKYVTGASEQYFYENSDVLQKPLNTVYLVHALTRRTSTVKEFVNSIYLRNE